MKSLLGRSIRYHHLPGNPRDGLVSLDLHDRAFRFWHEFWTGILAANGTSQKPDPDDFLRQEVLGVLEHQDKIIGLHGHCRFDLRFEATRSHSYFQRFFTPAILSALVKDGATRVLSMEMYSVLPEWRSPALGVSLAAVMTGLGVKLVQEWGVDAGVGIARVDLGVDKMVQNQGAVLLGAQVDVYNTPCVPIAFFPSNIRAHHKPEVNQLVEEFWKNRSDALSLDLSRPRKQTA